MMEVDLFAWLSRVDFSQLSGEVIAAGTQPHNALLRGVQSTEAYRFSWMEPAAQRPQPGS